MTEPSHESEEEWTCSACGNANPPGQAPCVHCGRLLQDTPTTQRLPVISEEQQSSAATGTVFANSDETLTLGIEAVVLTVPMRNSLTLGRELSSASGSQAVVDLTAYGALEKGGSRMHLKISRRSILFYVTDLGSANGTLLNGRNLVPQAARLLRSGDELQLGRLKIRIKF